MNLKARPKYRWGLVPLAIALLLALAFATSSGGNSPARSVEQEPLVLELLAQDVTETYIDLGDPDFSQSDQFVFHNDLFRGRRLVGRDGGLCTVTRVTAKGATTVFCSGSNSLPGGQITVQGLIDYAPGQEFKQEPYSLAITGGTGEYRTARGEVTITELSTRESVVTFRISPGGEERGNS